MPVADYLLAGIGFGLRALLLVRGVYSGIWRCYPVFCAFLIYSMVRSVALIWLVLSKSPAYASTYWVTEFVSFAFMFCVAFELFHRVFPPSSTLHRPAGLALASGLVLVAALFYFGSERPGQLIIPDVLRKAGTALAVWLMSVLLLARYYGQPVGRNVHGIATGLGLMVSVWIINLSAFGIDSSLFPILRYIGPISVLFVYVLWTFSLWYHIPILRPGWEQNEQVVQNSLADWQRTWHRLGNIFRKVIEP